jgi:acetoacetyl-CoA synthetase
MAANALWTPSSESIADTNLHRFADGAGINDYPDLHRWSIEQPSAFWSAIWEFCGLPTQIGPAVQPGAAFIDWRYFPDARLNVAEMIINGRGAGDGEAMYLSVNETNPRKAKTWTRADIRQQVATVAAALRSDGVQPGDRVAAWLPNIVETQIVMLATASIGAVFSSTSPDFGVEGVLDRFTQIAPSVLFAADGYSYGGKHTDCRERLVQIQGGLPSVRRTVLVSYADASSQADKTTSWADWTAPFLEAQPDYTHLPFDHPWYVLFSSGTTGLPKCIVHRTGGVLLQHLKEQQLHCDVRTGDRVMYFTTAGWMMWNWLASIPASGATAVLYEGSPFHPTPSALFDLAEAHELTFLGVGAKFIDSIRKTSVSPVATHDLSALRTIASTGSPLSIESFEWVYEHIASDLHLASISGGTDLCACFVAGDPTSPVYAGEIQRPALGMAVAVFNADGEPAEVGERGELVCTEPFPSMPLGFWADDDGTKYRAAYYERFPGVWAHGDFASWTEHGGMIIHGRSDTTLNPGGVRIGTSEIYRQVEQLPQVLESLVFGQDWQNDSRIVLLVRLVEGVQLDEALIAEIKQRIRLGCTPRHVPAKIIAVADLPRTRSGKLAELAVSDIVNGRAVRNTTALANPEVLAAIADDQELRI